MKTEPDVLTKFMIVAQRANAIVQDVLTNHLPRLEEGLQAGYVDENQALVIYDHLVRVRIMRECEQSAV